jgi:hypothetical protein
LSTFLELLLTKHNSNMNSKISSNNVIEVVFQHQSYENICRSLLSLSDKHKVALYSSSHVKNVNITTRQIQTCILCNSLTIVINMNSNMFSLSSACSELLFMECVIKTLHFRRNGMSNFNKGTLLHFQGHNIK